MGLERAVRYPGGGPVGSQPPGQARHGQRRRGEMALKLLQLHASTLPVLPSPSGPPPLCQARAITDLVLLSTVGIRTFSPSNPQTPSALASPSARRA